MNLRELVERGDRPFASHPQVARYFPAASMEDARRRLGRAIERGEGTGVAIGGAGSGKSLLLQVLAAQYRERFDVVLLACAQICTRRALLQAIHFELGLDYRQRDEGQLRLSLLDQLLASGEATQGLLLLVDEAQSLSTQLLEELRVLTNFSRGGLPRVRLVLAGLPSLEEKLASPDLESFSQRLSARCYIGPLTREETGLFIRAQLTASGAVPQQVFAASAFDAVFAATDGVPRLVNQLCDRALVLADGRRMSPVDASVVQAAWADLQQLPTPWETSHETFGTKPNAESVVEFGALEVKSEEPPPLAPRRAATETPSLTFNVARLADRIAAMPMLNAESDADEPNEPTELDDEHLSPPPTARAGSPHRPRVFTDTIPEAVDPFADLFEEEELVLDNFASLSGMFGTHTPRVENRREPSFARFVERMLESAAHDSAAPAKSDKLLIERDVARPQIRLAVVSDTPKRPPLPSIEPHLEDVVAEAAELDFNPPPTPTDDAEAAILVIEDDAVAASPAAAGVRRESYRQLFSRLRHGA